MIRVSGGRWYRQAASAGRDDRAGHAGEGRGSGRRTHCSCNVVTGALRRNRCAATAVTVSPLRRNRLFSEGYTLVANESATASSWRFRLLEAASA